jgi:hypothetical protein
VVAYLLVWIKRAQVTCQIRERHRETQGERQDFALPAPFSSWTVSERGIAPSRWDQLKKRFPIPSSFVSLGSLPTGGGGHPGSFSQCMEQELPFTDGIFNVMDWLKHSSFLSATIAMMPRHYHDQAALSLDQASQAHYPTGYPVLQGCDQTFDKKYNK